MHSLTSRLAPIFKSAYFALTIVPLIWVVKLSQKASRRWIYWNRTGGCKCWRWQGYIIIK